MNNKWYQALVVRCKNMYFWLGMIAIVLQTIGVNEGITTWGELGTYIMQIASNPVRLLLTLIAVVGVIVNPTTPGFKD